MSLRSCLWRPVRAPWESRCLNRPCCKSRLGELRRERPSRSFSLSFSPRETRSKPWPEPISQPLYRPSPEVSCSSWRLPSPPLHRGTHLDWEDQLDSRGTAASPSGGQVHLLRPEGPPYCLLSSKTPGSSGKGTTLLSRTTMSVGPPRWLPRVSISSPIASVGRCWWILVLTLT